MGRKEEKEKEKMRILNGILKGLEYLGIIKRPIQRSIPNSYFCIAKSDKPESIYPFDHKGARRAADSFYDSNEQDKLKNGAA